MMTLVNIFQFLNQSQLLGQIQLLINPVCHIPVLLAANCSQKSSQLCSRWFVLLSVCLSVLASGPVACQPVSRWASQKQTSLQERGGHQPEFISIQSGLAASLPRLLSLAKMRQQAHRERVDRLMLTLTPSLISSRQEERQRGRWQQDRSFSSRIIIN